MESATVVKAGEVMAEVGLLISTCIEDET
jgi:hypothetical protein